MVWVEVLDQSIEQYSILLKTKDEISSFTLFIWYNLEKQEETVFEIWWS